MSEAPRNGNHWRLDWTAIGVIASLLLSGGQFAYFIGVTSQRITALELTQRDDRDDHLVERVSKLEAYWDNLKSIIDRIDRRLDARSPG